MADIKGMDYRRVHSAEYRHHIDKNSPEWQAAKERRMQIDGYRCACCGRSIDEIRAGRLYVHHTAYTDNLFDPHYLLTICGLCHGILEGRLVPTPFQFDPRTPSARRHLTEYIKKSDAYIDGKTATNEGLDMPDGRPYDVYKRYSQYYTNYYCH